MSETVLVTGGAGFVGSHLVGALAAREATTLVIDGRGPSEVSDRCTYLQLDLRSTAARAAIVRFAPQRVFHLAGAALIPYCNEHPREALESNVGGTAALLHALRAAPPESVVFASSAAVYGYGERLDETSPTRPSEIYGISKLLAEDLLRLFHEEVAAVRCRIARIFNPYGSGDSPSRLLPRVLRAHVEGVPLRLGNLWPKRDFVHVADVVEALLRLDGTDEAFGVVNVASGVGTSVEALVELVSSLTGASVPVEQLPEQMRADDGHRVADVSRLADEIGWRARYDLEAGVRELLAG
jgi:nucleoside-diphosphate-sugar epimerase